MAEPQSPTLTLLADAARHPAGAAGLLPSGSPVLHSAAALVVLLGAAVMSIVEPRGLTRYGWRRQHAVHASRRTVRSLRPLP